MAAIPQNLGVPTGTVMWSAAPEVPVGWLLCDGKFVTVGDYPELYAHIGNTYGGDGVTFGIPNLVGRFILAAGDPGREPFTYEDGINKEHVHGMKPETEHTHNVVDPQHEHPTSSGSHSHNTTSNHSHTNTSDHKHRTAYNNTDYLHGFVTHDYFLVGGNCDTETYAPNDPFDFYTHCARNPDTDFFRTYKYLFDNPNRTNPLGKTGITQVNTNVTGTSVEIAFTGVTLATQITDVSLAFSPTGLSVDDFGVVGGPRPKNIAFLPIIRT